MDDANTKALAAEHCHYYAKDGSPRYSIIGKNGKERAVTIKDAREHGWVPSVTTILQVADKPGLNIWKAKQILEAALTLPRLPDENLDDYATRIIEDSKAQGKKAAERGTELHAAIEQFIQGQTPPKQWTNHIAKLYSTLLQYGIELLGGNAEHSFASPLGYGGKIDWHNDEIVLDFKTKANLEPKRLAYDEHCWQLAAYMIGLDGETVTRVWKVNHKRLINVFVGIDDISVRIHEHEEPDIEKGFRAFKCLLNFWQITKNYTP